MGTELDLALLVRRAEIPWVAGAVSTEKCNALCPNTGRYTFRLVNGRTGVYCWSHLETVLSSPEELERLAAEGVVPAAAVSAGAAR